MNTPITLIRGQGKLLEACVAFNQTSKKWQAEGRILAASVCVHAHITGDIRPIITLIASMPKGVKTNSMRDYVLKFGPVKWSDTLKKFKFDDKRQLKAIMEPTDNGQHKLLETMLSTDWWAMRKEEDADSYKPLNLEGKLLSLIKTANKALKEGDPTKETVTKQEVAAVEELYRRLYAKPAAA